MDIIANIDVLREQVIAWRRQGLSTAFVPTMGNLHDGHLTLVKEAQKFADRVVVSIFVNPMQFNQAADLAAYPRTLDEDCRALQSVDTDLVFTPSPELIYPHGLASQTFIQVPGISEVLEGAHRPGHFNGVSTIVAKLFNLVQPDVALFGEKDFQQLALIRHMVADLAMPIQIVGVPTVREKSGLAMSSRNGLLTAEERIIAPLLAEVMTIIAGKISVDEQENQILVTQATAQLNAAGFNTDAIDIVDAETLASLTTDSKQAVVLMAAFLGKARLIDNKVIELT
ncbi:pantoate--beta-alanine ligase [Moritella sp. F3]|uniref:pantoate--beta-alanine ligase n=1 Tax=Moritella sp. F3 TaxID=2718882 RepID=UPI0018E1024E|nr:pantoate--beta-alanine ligase [Moritella sp. F3]GIC75964.1 pantothenate synthetase [Moritella sp. F1]GIC81503.1 pantothenate synthetase [Moritella sp. F3]